MFQIARPTVKPWVNLGMDKLGNQAVNNGATTPLTGWEARSGYSGPTGDALLIPRNANVNIFAKVTVNSSLTSNCALVIYSNGTEIKRLTFGGTSSSKTWVDTLTVSSGASITLGLFNDWAGRTLLAGSTNTYFYMEKI